MAEFGDHKDEGALRTIGEVSVALGIKPHVLRYWEEQFEQLRPLKRAGGRRLYRAHDVALVRRIDSMVNREGYTLKGARLALGGTGALPVSAVEVPAAPAASAAAPGDLLLRLKAIRSELADALADDASELEHG